MKLAESTWPEIAQLDKDRTVIVAPYAACEQHGPHLPYYTDTFLVTAVAEAVEQKLPDEMLLTPTQWLGASSHHLPFGGTLSAPVDLHIRLITDPLREYLRQGWTRLLILNGHGGNIDTYHVALRTLHDEFPQAHILGASYWEAAEQIIADRLEGPFKQVGHAGEAETSLMLAVRPDLVRMDLRRDCQRRLRPELEGLYVPFDMKGRTREGVDGFPSYANAEKGKDMLAAIADRMVEVVRGLIGGAEWRD